MRKISSKLIEQLKNEGLKDLLNYIKSDNDLRLEVRSEGDAFVYYRKGKALEIKKLKVDPKYGKVPPTDLAKSDPKLYFQKIKQSIDTWLKSHKRAEFDTQQNIASQNQSIDDKYIIIDMEYAFARNKIEKEDREKQACFDLLGIERATGKIILFEVKTGLGAIKGKSGIDDHIKDFETIMHGKSNAIFKAALRKDVENIISDKVELGIITNFNVPTNLEQYEPELIFIFHPTSNNPTNEIELFKAELEGKKELIIVTDENFKLK